MHPEAQRTPRRGRSSCGPVEPRHVRAWHQPVAGCCPGSLVLPSRLVPLFQDARHLCGSWECGKCRGNAQCTVWTYQSGPVIEHAFGFMVSRVLFGSENLSVNTPELLRALPALSLIASPTAAVHRSSCTSDSVPPGVCALGCVPCPGQFVRTVAVTGPDRRLGPHRNTARQRTEASPEIATRGVADSRSKESEQRGVEPLV